MRLLVIMLFLVVLASTVAYSASMTATIGALGGGTATVAHIAASTCEVGTSDVNVVSDAIDTVTVTLTCDTTGTYSAEAVVVSGASSSTNSNTVSLTAGTPGSVTIDTNPNIDTVGASGYSINYTVTPQ